MLEITLEEICRYPVKSMLGESLAETLLGEQGIPGDRSWATRDPSGGFKPIPNSRHANHFAMRQRSRTRIFTRMRSAGRNNSTRVVARASGRHGEAA